MPVTLKDIKGLLLSKRFHMEHDSNKLIRNCVSCDKNDGFNSAIDYQGERKIGLNREKLKKILDKFDFSYLATHLGTYEISDAIIAAESEIIEVKE